MSLFGDPQIGGFPLGFPFKPHKGGTLKQETTIFFSSGFYCARVVGAKAVHHVTQLESFCPKDVDHAMQKFGALLGDWSKLNNQGTAGFSP